MKKTVNKDGSFTLDGTPEEIAEYDRLSAGFVIDKITVKHADDLAEKVQKMLRDAQEEANRKFPYPWPEPYVPVVPYEPWPQTTGPWYPYPYYTYIWCETTTSDKIVM